MLFPYLDTPFEALARVYKTGAIAESSLLCRIRVAEVHKILGLSCRSRRKVPDPAVRSGRNRRYRSRSSKPIPTFQERMLWRSRAGKPVLAALGVSRQRICSMLRLALEALDACEVHRPRQRRAAPALLCRMQIGPAVERAHPQAVGCRVGARGRRIDRRAAFGAERVHPL